MVRRFEIINHKADIGLAVYGRSLGELMANAAEGMFSLMTDISRIGNSTVRRIELRNDDEETLLVEWLNELLLVFEVERLLFSSFDVTVEVGNRLLADCRGEKFNPTKHSVNREIKAATYHNLNIVRGADGYSVKIIFDI